MVVSLARTGFRPSLRAAIILITLSVLLPLVIVVAASISQAGRSLREMSANQLIETARILAQSTASELDAIERFMMGAGATENAISQGDVLFSSLETQGIEGSFLRIPPGGSLNNFISSQIDREVLARALRTQRPALSNLHSPPDEPGRHLITIAVSRASPVGGHDAALIRGHPRSLIRALSRQEFGGGSAILAITDGTGRLLARSVDGERFVGRQVPDWDRLQAAGGREGTFRAMTIEGNGIVFAFRAIEGTPGWMAVVGEPMAVYDARWQEPIRLMVLTSIGVIIGGLGLATFLSSRMLAPIRHLVNRAQRVARGEALDDGNKDASPPALIAEFETLRQSLEVADNVLAERLAESERAKLLAESSVESLLSAERLAKLGSWTLDVETKTYTLSQTMRELAGASEIGEIATSAEVSSYFSDTTVAKFNASLKHCRETGEPFGFLTPFHSKVHGEISTWVQAHAFRDASGEVVQIRGSVQDVSESMEHNQRLAALADNLPRGVIVRILRDQRRYLSIDYVSGGVQSLLGMGPEAFLQRPAVLFDLIAKEDWSIILAELRERDEAGSVIDHEFRLRLPEEDLVWLRFRGALRPLPDGRFVWDGICFDITAERAAAEELRQAKLDAEEAGRAKSDFLATMSHEIRTPMNSVIGLTRLALKTPLDSKQRTYLENINASANVLLGIINDILDFSRIEAGGLSLERSDFKLEEVLETVSSINALKAEDKGLELSFRVAPDVPMLLKGDALRLGQVLTNLVGNAVKFTEAGDVQIAIRLLEQGADGEQVLQFEVIDSGIGLTQVQIEGLFRPFTQANSDTARLYGGTGLGLAICKRLVELMGGRIWVESEQGRGSRFCFTAAFGATSHSDLLEKRRMQLRDASVVGRRVLVVDDNAFAREALSEMVAGFGMSVVAAASGDEAMNLLHEAQTAKDPIDLALVDWRMPEMDGIALSKLIRADSQLKHLPAVLMVTAYGHQFAASAVQECDLQGLILKPVTPSVVFNTIQDALSQISIPNNDKVTPDLSDLSGYRDKLAGLHVLVVDDHPLNRDVATEFLKLVDVSSSHAVNGHDALAKLGEKDFDAVLLDVQMPVMNGLEAVRAIRQNPNWAELPVIALTAQSREEDAARGLEAGMTAFLTKPMDEVALYELLSGLFSSRRNRAATKRSSESSDKSRDLSALLPGLASMSSDIQLRFLRDFESDFGGCDGEFARFLAARDWSELEGQAHNLKGMVGYLCEDKILEILARLEIAARAQDEPTCAVLLEALRPDMNRCLARINAALAA